MMLPFRNRLDSVLLPPPLLYTDPFPLDDILDVSEIKREINQWFIVEEKTTVSKLFNLFNLYFPRLIVWCKKEN